MNLTEYIEKRSTKLPWSGCHIWTKSTTRGGYGRSSKTIKNYGTSIVHRALFIELHGKIADDLYVCHHCDIPQCVNPDHFFLGTPSENAQDRTRKGRSSSRLGECNGRAILSIQQVAGIKQDLLAKQKQKTIAKKYNVSQSTISRIHRGTAWGE